MAFKNEHVLPLEQETSEFFRKAQKTINVTYEIRSQWTIDRERDMALVHRGGGHSMEDYNEENWSFLDRKGLYYINTERLSQSVISPEEIAITRSIYFMTGGSDIVPDAETIACIKEALHEFKDYGVISDYNRCRLTLIDARTKKEI